MDSFTIYSSEKRQNNLYSIFERSGNKIMRPYTITPIEKRFWKHVSTEPNTGCWLWTGMLSDLGYGRLWSREKQLPINAHRLSYEMHKGKIPDNLTLDHLCRTRSCVNPDHLEAVPLQENIRRGFSPPAMNARKTHCNRGHNFSGFNLILRSDGGRRCRQCKNNRRVSSQSTSINA